MRSTVLGRVITKTDAMECRYLLISVFVFFCQTLIFSAALPVDLVEIDEYDAQNCTHNGVTHEIGEKWGDSCLKFHCVKGHVKILHAACEFNGHCKSAGSVWTAHCIKRTCLNNHGKLHIKILQTGCPGKKHHCHKVGAKWQEKHHDKCQVRKCVKVEHTIVTKILNDECSAL